MRKVADWVIVDAPSLEHASAALNVAPMVDAIVLVVEADRTGAVDVANAKNDLEARGGHVIGAVMNRIGADARVADRFSA